MVGGFFNSKSSSSTDAAETGQQTSGPASPAVSLSNIDQHKGNGNLTVNLEMTDQGALDDAFAFAGEAGTFYAEQLAAAQDGAFAFAGEAGASAAETVRQAIEGNAGVTINALENAEAMGTAVMAANLEQVAMMGDYGLESQLLSAETSRRGLDAIRETAAGAIDAQRSTAADYIDASSRLYDQGLEFAAGALLLTQDATDQAASAMANAYGESLDAIEAANQSETAKLSEQMVYAVLGLVALMAWRATV